MGGGRPARQAAPRPSACELGSRRRQSVSPECERRLSVSPECEWRLSVNPECEPPGVQAPSVSPDWQEGTYSSPRAPPRAGGVKVG